MIVHCNGIDIFYEVRGSGAPLLMLHGNGETHAIFDESASLLSRFFAMLRPACAARWGGAEGCALARKPMPMRAKKAAGVAEFGFFALTLQP